MCIESENKPGVDMLDLGPNQCKFPVTSEGKNHTFCGEPADGSWCDHHKKVVYPPK